MEEKLAEAGLDKLVTSDDIAEVRRLAKQAEAIIIDKEIRDKPTNTSEYRSAFYRRASYANIAEGKPMMEGISLLTDQQAVQAESPYDVLATYKRNEFGRASAGQLPPEERQNRELHFASSDSMDLARVELEMIRIALMTEKVRIVGAVENGEIVNTTIAQEYASMERAYAAYLEGDKTQVIELGDGSKTTAGELMQAHIRTARSEVAGRLKKAREERSAEQEVGDPAQEVEPVPEDEAGYKAYEKKYFSEFDPDDIHEAELQAYIRATLDFRERLHASANNPNIRHPDSVASVLSSNLGGVNKYIACLYNLRGGPDGQKVKNVREVLPMKFSKLAKQCLGMDVEDSHPGYFKVFRAS